MKDTKETFKRPGHTLLHSFIRGSIGKEYVIRRCGNKHFISKYPNRSHVKPTPAEEENRKRFKYAVEFAKKVIADENLTQEIKKLTRCGRYVYTAAIKYYFKQQRSQEAKALLQTDQLLKEISVKESEQVAISSSQSAPQNIHQLL